MWKKSEVTVLVNLADGSEKELGGSAIVSVAGFVKNAGQIVEELGGSVVEYTVAPYVEKNK